MARHGPAGSPEDCVERGVLGGEDVIGAFFACEDSSGFDYFYEFRR